MVKARELCWFLQFKNGENLRLNKQRKENGVIYPEVK
jgi:hypothetical protein